MNARERWVRCMHFQPVDHIPDEEFGYWSDTLKEWHRQGLPERIDSNEKADRYFGFGRRESVPISVKFIPFEEKILKENDLHKIVINSRGLKIEIFKNGTDSIPHYLEFPIKNREDWLRYKARWGDPEDPENYPHNWEELRKEWADRDYPLGIGVGSLFGSIRGLMGFEKTLLTFYDNPAWIEEMMEFFANLTLQSIKCALEKVELDFALFGEDMAFKTGPMISPTFFRKFMTPRYERITDTLRRYHIDVVIVDSDGNINELVGPWLESGVNCMFPLEINSYSDPVSLRKKFGRKVLLAGGVDKMALIQGKQTIRKEIKRVKPLVKEGGYIPHVDHRCPPDVTFENYLYYLDVKRETFGIPKPEEFESRPEVRKIKSKWKGIPLSV